MSEDTTSNANVEQPTGQQEQQREFSDVEKRAMELGWVPKEDYNGDPDRWRSAEVFVALDEPIKRIESQSKELKQVRLALDSLKQHYTQVRETEYKRALNDLKAARKQALVDGDIDKFDLIEDRIEEVKQEADEIRQQAQSQPAQTVNPEFQSWVNKNPWYAQYSHMRTFADEVGIKLHQSGLTPQEVLKKVEESVRKEFPHKFTNPNKANAPAVESGAGAQSKGSKSSDKFDLTEQERTIMNTLVRSGTITKEQYLADLKKVKGLE